MTKKEDGTFIFKANPEDFPQRHKANVINIGIAETGLYGSLIHYSSNVYTTVLMLMRHHSEQLWLEPGLADLFSFCLT